MKAHLHINLNYRVVGLCLAVAYMTACSKMEEQLVGHWRYVDGKKQGDLFLEPDKTFRQTTGGGFYGTVLQTLNGTIRGRWSVSGRKVTLNFETAERLGSLAFQPGLMDDQHKHVTIEISSISKDEFVTADGGRMVRVRDH